MDNHTRYAAYQFGRSTIVMLCFFWACSIVASLVGPQRCISQAQGHEASKYVFENGDVIGKLSTRTMLKERSWVSAVLIQPKNLSLEAKTVVCTFSTPPSNRGERGVSYDSLDKVTIYEGDVREKIKKVTVTNFRPFSILD